MTKILPDCLTDPTPKVARLWLGLSVLIALAYSLLALRQGIQGSDVIQDDARQHVFWMRRFLDPDLFPQDWIADYFQSVAPSGYSELYRLGAIAGVDPVLMSKFVPVGLSVITAALSFSVCWQLLPVPIAAFSSSVLLSQALGLTDAVVSGTPKAFIYPIFLAFLYGLMRRSLWICIGAIALEGLFYPQLVFLSAGLLAVRLVNGSPKLTLTRQRSDWWFSGIGILVAIAILLPYALKSSQFGPVISIDQARELPEFLPGGRSQFFNDADPWSFWIKGRGGIRVEAAFTPVTNSLGILLPIVLRFPKRFPLSQRITKNLWIIPQLLLVSGLWFGLAHLVLFRLHLPSRYTEHSLRILLTLSAGMVLAILVDAAIQWGRSHQIMTQLASVSLPSLLAIALLGYPAIVAQFPITHYITGEFPELYDFFQQQPPDSLIASLDPEADNLPTFAQRSILTGEEYSVPYHWGYYQELRQRTLDTIQAQFTTDFAQLSQFIEKYGVDFWLLRRASFNPRSLNNNAWLQQFQPEIREAIAQLRQGTSPVLATRMDSCAVFQDDKFTVVDANCLLRSTNAPN